MNATNEVSLILTGILAVGAAIAYLGLKLRQKKLKEQPDPDYQQKQLETASEYRRLKAEEAELSDLALTMNGSHYIEENDDDEEE